MDIFVDRQFHPLYREHPIVLVDAGARGGVKRDWLPARPYLRTIGFEPDKKEYDALMARPGAADSGDKVFGVALHSEAGPVELRITKDRGLSSVFEPNRAFLDRFPDADRFDVIDRQVVSGQRLDDVLRDNHVGNVDFIKVDTQGSELPILQGASDILANAVVGLEVEVEFSPIYSGQPLFADVDAFLRQHGFQLFDLRPCYWKRKDGQDLGGPFGQLIWADALYLKVPEHVASMAGRLPSSAAKAKVMKAATIALLFGYQDAALEVLQVAGGVLDPAERDLAMTTLRANTAGRPPLPDFPGKRWLAALATRGVRLFSDPRAGWSVGAGKIGNQK